MSAPYGPPMAMDPLVAMLLASGGGAPQAHPLMGAPVDPHYGYSGQGDYAPVKALQAGNAPGSGYMDALALALQGNDINVPTQRYKGDSGGFGVGLVSGLEHGFSTSRLADMQHRQKLQDALTQQAHDANVANHEATVRQQEQADRVALKAAPDGKLDWMKQPTTTADMAAMPWLTAAQANGGLTHEAAMQLRGEGGRPQTVGLDLINANTKLTLGDLGKPLSDPGVASRMVGRPEKPETATDRQAALDTTNGELIANEIIAGRQSPKLGVRLTPEVMAVKTALAKKGYNQKNAEYDFDAVQKWQGTQNSSKFQTVRANISAADQGLALVDQLAEQVSKLVPRTDLPKLNAVLLGSAKQMGAYGPAAQDAANKLASQVAEVRSLLASIYMGSNAPTDHAFKQAHDILSGNWSLHSLHAAAQLARQNLVIRGNSMDTQPVSAGGGATIGASAPGGAAPSGMFGPGGSMGSGGAGAGMGVPQPAAATPLFGPAQSVPDFAKSIGATPRVAVPAHTRKAPVRGK